MLAFRQATKTTKGRQLMRLMESAVPAIGYTGVMTTDLREIVMGLHWDPRQGGAGANAADLDALCVLFDADQRILEVIHPNHLRTAGDSVVHTGDSPNGASVWDDERIFVFLDKLPQSVAALAFVVASANGRGFHLAQGASCHVSDQMTEHEWVRLDLTAYTDCLAKAVACLVRNDTGWHIASDCQSVSEDLLTELRQLIAKEKKAKSDTKIAENN